jgi:hypothetical protein
MFTLKDKLKINENQIIFSKYAFYYVKQAYHCVNVLNNILNDVILLVMFLTIYVS